jgi:hypothetical protein
MKLQAPSDFATLPPHMAVSLRLTDTLINKT